MAKKKPKIALTEKQQELARRSKIPHQNPKTKGRAWEPTARDLQWYTDVKVLRRSYRWVAAQSGLSGQYVYGRVKRTEDWMRSQHKRTVMEHREYQTDVLEHIMGECWRAYERSCGNTESITLKETPTENSEQPDGKTILTTMMERITKTDKQVGDPRFLELILKVLRDIRDIWGVDKPQEVVVHTGPYDELLPIGGKSRDQAKEDQLRAELAKIEARKKEAKTELKGVT